MRVAHIARHRISDTFPSFPPGDDDLDPEVEALLASMSDQD